MATKSATEKTFWDLPLKGWLQSGAKKSAGKSKAATSKIVAKIHFLGPTTKAYPARKMGCPDWLWDELSHHRRGIVHWADEAGAHWIVAPECCERKPGAGSLPGSTFGAYRDRAGSALSEVLARPVDEVQVENQGLNGEKLIAALTGLEMGHYRYQRTRKGNKPPKLFLLDCEKAAIDEASRLGVAVNIGRHLVNIPSDELHPESYAASLKKLFAGGDFTVETWTKNKLEAQKCGMILAVGRGAPHSPVLVRLKYRPAGAKGKPVAFVGKGVTFDSGGLNIKPGAGMRLMKKDMGGSASVVGLAYWVKESKIKRPLDFYLALSENALDAHAFHPGDVLTSRKGLTVEIHNTDAEGRLVLGDALDVAVTRTGKDKPELVIDFATLTGAMRVGLGLGIAGFFATDQKVADKVSKAGLKMGDPLWQMPLVDEYEPLLRSTFADMSNAASVPYGGAITAALFLRKFVNNTPWVHVDMMSWTDKKTGAFGEIGGNGQVIQAMAKFLSD